MHAGGPVLLAVGACSQERAFLRRLCVRSGWKVHWAQTLRGVLRALRKRRIGVLLCEGQFPDGHGWKDLLEETQRLDSPPKLIVTDRLADERLWAEVLNRGGYDLLMKPLVPEEVFRVTRSAWAAWKLEHEKARKQAA